MTDPPSRAIEVNGTFTDFVVLDHKWRIVSTDKVLTTPQHPEHSIMQLMK
jgi:N-methylhydantoinase A/oxoprolinase/acetone carboxylase beta subunit